MCRKCSGEGRVRVRKQVPLTIPAGVASGSALRVRGTETQAFAGKGPYAAALIEGGMRRHIRTSCDHESQ